MRILSVTSRFDAVGDRIRSMADCGGEVRLICAVSRGPRPPGDELAGLPVRYARYYTFPVVGERFAAFAFDRGIRNHLHDEIRSFQPDVIDVHDLYPDAVGALSAAKKRGVPVAVTAHGRDVMVLGRLPAIHEKLVLSLLDASVVITVTDALRAALSGQRIYRKEISVIPDGVDAERFSPNTEAGAQLGLDPERRHLVCAGEGGGKLLLSALTSEESPRGATVHFLAGKKHARLARAMGLGDRVVFHEGVEWDRVPLWYAAADAVIQLGRASDGARAVRESLACQTPVLGADIPFMRELVRPHRDGLLVPLNLPGVTRGLVRILEKEWSRPFPPPRTWNQVGEELLARFSRINS